MPKCYIVTGAAGHLGRALVQQLADAGCSVRALIMPSEPAPNVQSVFYCRGDVRHRESLLPLFADADTCDLIILHAAGIVDISGEKSDLLREVNVEGTRNMLELSLAHHVRRFVYISSVHALPELEGGQVITEVSHYSPDLVVGDYAKTKAEAAQLVMDASVTGMSSLVILPSGIVGPDDDLRGNHVVQMVDDYLAGKIPACVDGGYDFVDVRDVAHGCLLAAEHGRAGESYILSNRHYEVRELLSMIRHIKGGRKLPVLPMWFVRAFAPLITWFAHLRKRRPLYTLYSLYVLKSNDKFSHDKATAELGYRPRDLYQTIKDTIDWLEKHPVKGK